MATRLEQASDPASRRPSRWSSEESAWDWWPHRYRCGQLVLRRRDDAVRRVVAHDPLDDTYLLDDRLWVAADEIEDPLVEGRRRELERGASDSARREAVARGDFGAVFPGVAARRQRSGRLGRALGAAGWITAAAEAGVLLLFLLEHI